MRVNDLYPVLAACLLGSITGVTSVALPESGLGFSLARRQNDVEAGEVETEDTKDLRQCREPRPIYIGQDNVEWYEVNKDKTKLEVTTTTKKDEDNVPAPKDKDQGSRFVTDHVLELMVVQAAFDDKNRKYNDDAKKISDDAWKKAHNAVNGGNKDNCIKVAEKITVLDNLLGIAEQINLGKEVIFRKVIQDKTDTDLKPKWKDYLKAIQGYLDDFKSKVETTADNTGGAFKDFTGEDVVGTYFATFCKEKYKAGQDYVKDQLDKQDGGEQTAQCLPLGSEQPISTRFQFFDNYSDGC
ncbi:MAG: hypothetical protein Q9223_000779 [Gallowayella weberi]